MLKKRYMNLAQKYRHSCLLHCNNISLILLIAVNCVTLVKKKCEFVG